MRLFKDAVIDVKRRGEVVPRYIQVLENETHHFVGPFFDDSGEFYARVDIPYGSPNLQFVFAQVQDATLYPRFRIDGDESTPIVTTLMEDELGDVSVVGYDGKYYLKHRGLLTLLGRYEFSSACKPEDMDFTGLVKRMLTEDRFRYEINTCGELIETSRVLPGKSKSGHQNVW